VSLKDSSTKSVPFQFTGDSLEYFRIWIVNLVLTILTLGIYSAWAKVRTNRYFYGNTLVHGSAFNYTADPVKILRGRIFAVVLFIIYQAFIRFYPVVAGYILIVFVLFLPFIYVMNMAFKMRYTTWRGINFNFYRDYRIAYLVFAPIIIYIVLVSLAPLIIGLNEEVLLEPTENADEFSSEMATYLVFVSGVAIVGMFCFPLWQKFYYQFIGNRASYGNASFSFSVSSWKFYKIYLVAFFMIVGGMLLYALFIGLSLNYFAESLTLNRFTFTLLPLILILIPYLLAFSYIQTRLTNVIYSNLRLEDICFESKLSFVKMTVLYITNTLAILVSIGLAIPWTKIRMARYRADNMYVLSDTLEEFVAVHNEDINAGADAFSDIFDLDIGL